MTKISLPEIPTTPMFIDDVMTIEWQEFFRDIFRRTGGYQAKTNIELEDLAMQAKQVPAMLFDPLAEEAESMLMPGTKGNKGDQGLMGAPGMDGEDGEGLGYVGFPLQEERTPTYETVTVKSTAPIIMIWNITEEDLDGGREGYIPFKGMQSGGELSTLGWIYVSHDGALDDQKGRMYIGINEGADGDTPTTYITLKDGAVGIKNTTPHSSVGLDAGDDINTSGHYEVNLTQVVGAQQPAEANSLGTTAISVGAGSDAIDLATFNTDLGTFRDECEAIATKLNNLLAKLRTHGLIAT